MAKDPAFLFYSSDFMMGTALMSESEVGQYIRILCHMHQSGHLSIEDMKNICPNISSKVVAKFRVDDAGLYYNERLDAEVAKRKSYSESRRKNRLQNKKESYDITYVNHMTAHMENENENIIKDDVKKGGMGENILSDESLDQIFDAAYLDPLPMVYRGVDIQDELRKFKIKIRGAPDDYKHRDTGGIRNAFLHQLKTARPNINKNANNNGTKSTTSAQVGGTSYNGKRL